MLIGDLGGTNARFAVVDGSEVGYGEEKTLACRDYETAEEAMAEYLASVGGLKPNIICLAVAGVVVDQKMRFLNNHWSINGSELSGRFNGARVRLLNDFEAVSLSLTSLRAGDTEQVGPVRFSIEGEEEYSLGVVGPGTGLGMGGLVSRNGHSVPLVGEGGHKGFAPETAVQLRVLKVLRERFERVSNERLLCGPGLDNIYSALQEINGLRQDPLSAVEIFKQAMDNSNDSAAETVQLFFEALGQVAGDLALGIGALNGVFIGGGIVKRYPELLKAGSFRSGFENKGRYRSLMERIPTLLITHPQPGLLGASHMARQIGQRSGRRMVKK